MAWGSAASPLLVNKLLIIPAGDPSSSLRALDTSSGTEVWKIESPKLKDEKSSPILVGPADKQVLVVAVDGEVWGLDPRTGAKLWTVETDGRGGPNATPVSEDGLVFVSGGMGGLSTAIRAGQLSEEDESRVAWESRQAAGISSPVMHSGILYIVDRRGLVVRMDTASGETLEKGGSTERLSGGVYASPIIAGDRLYVISREGRALVYSTSDAFELLGSSQFVDDSRFNASPAIVDGALYVRSDKYIYCIRAQEQGAK